MGLYDWGSCWRLLEGCLQEHGTSQGGFTVDSQQIRAPGQVRVLRFRVLGDPPKTLHGGERTSTWSTSRRSTSASRSRPRRTTTSTSGARRWTPRRSSGHHIATELFLPVTTLRKLAPVRVDMIMHAIAPRPPPPERDAHGGLKFLDEQQSNNHRMSPVCAMYLTISSVSQSSPKQSTT